MNEGGTKVRSTLSKFIELLESHKEGPFPLIKKIESPSSSAEAKYAAYSSLSKSDRNSLSDLIKPLMNHGVGQPITEKELRFRMDMLVKSLQTGDLEEIKKNLSACS